MGAVKKDNLINLVIYTIMHFLVDLSCIFFLTGMIYVRQPSAEAVTRIAVIYNALAFALPMLLGFAADIVGQNAFTSCLGVLLILINYLVIPDIWVSVLLTGVGNGLFHIGGGRQVLHDSEYFPERDTVKKRFAPSGIFIASGAMGVYLGRNMGVNFRNIYYVCMWIALAVCVVILAFCGFKQQDKVRKSHPAASDTGKGMLITSLLIFIVVIIRSYYGYAASFSWNSGFLTGLIFTLCIVAGKALGGIVADKLGVGAASIISLGGAGITALFAAGSPVTGCISMLLFNMTMPITLTLLAEVWHELPGFAFGALMLALFLGTLPTMVFKIRILSTPWGLFALCMISLALLLAAILKPSGHRA